MRVPRRRGPPSPALQRDAMRARTAGRQAGGRRQAVGARPPYLLYLCEAGSAPRSPPLHSKDQKTTYVQQGDMLYSCEARGAPRSPPRPRLRLTAPPRPTAFGRAPCAGGPTCARSRPDEAGPPEGRRHGPGRTDPVEGAGADAGHESTHIEPVRGMVRPCKDHPSRDRGGPDAPPSESGQRRARLATIRVGTEAGPTRHHPSRYRGGPDSPPSESRHPPWSRRRARARWRTRVGRPGPEHGRPTVPPLVTPVFYQCLTSV
jgi:hypothetical protein